MTQSIEQTTSEMKKFYFAYWDTRRDPVNMGLVPIDERGFIDGETPIEDFGCYLVRKNKPITEDVEQLTAIFLRLMRDR